MTTTNTARLHRVIAAKPEKVFRALTEAGARERWLPPNGFIGKTHHLEAKVGGTYRMSFTNFTTGSEIFFGGEFREFVPGKRLSYTDKFEDPNLPGEMDLTIDLVDVGLGTEITIVQAGLPDVIPLAGCYMGWQESLLNLARLVEPEIPDGAG